jgi:TPR repeat protein
VQNSSPFHVLWSLQVVSLAGWLATGGPTSLQAYEGHSVNLQPINAPEKRARSADREALFLLGIAYAEGRGVRRDYAQALGWYRKAAEAGDARAMNSLGLLYRQGFGVPADPIEAARWLQRSADTRTDVRSAAVAEPRAARA